MNSITPQPVRALLFLLVINLPLSTFAQNPNTMQHAPQGSAATKADTMSLLLDFSRPGFYHALLGPLAGTWAFQDAKLAFVKGTLTRKPIYDGRFYQVEIKGGRLQVPVADGKMKEDNYQQLQTEGYDNGRMQFVTSSINNHIGSDIEIQMGTYDATTKSFTYVWESELMPGLKRLNKRVVKIIDNDHYIEEYYEIRNGKAMKVRELDFARTTGN
jgi:hypothetical protein